MDRSGIPPTSPYGQFSPIDLLPPLIPTSYRKFSPTSSMSDSTGESLHHRSASDIPPAFRPAAISGEKKPGRNASCELFDAFLCFDEMNGSKMGACSSESEGESNGIECGGGNGKHSRHARSVSMDGLMGKGGSKRGQNSRSEFMDGEFCLEFGNGEFSGAELKKIMTDKRLEEIALADPKRAKRVLANRQSAARSKERKMRYISELERRVQTLQSEATTLSTQLTLLQRDSSGLASQNNELKIRLHAMEQQAQLLDALNEALTTEVQRLRLATTQMDDSLPKQIKTASSIKS